MMYEQNNVSIWAISKYCATSPQAGVLNTCLQRLDKAHGHINAIERKLWYDRERAIWSANQAKAKVVELLLYLQDNQTEVTPIEKYIHKSKLPQLLGLLDDLFPSQTVLNEVKESENNILSEPFPALGPGSMNQGERKALEYGLARQYRYTNALWSFLEVAETEVAKRFLVLKVGDWLRVHDGNTAVVISMHGLSINVFIPSRAKGDLLQAIRTYWLARSNLAQVPPIELPFYGPAHYWLSLSSRLLKTARHLLHNTNELKTVRDLLIQIIDATSKSWWLMNIPGERQVSWGHCQLRNAHLLHKNAPQCIAGVLSGAASTIEILSGWSPNARIVEPDSSWEFQFAVMLEAIELVIRNIKSNYPLMSYVQQKTPC